MPRGSRTPRSAGWCASCATRYDDRFSHYFDPSQLKQFKQSTSGSFSGVGLSVSEVKPGLRVTTVFDDTPAPKRAGIREGDVILAVDGHSIAGEPADVATGTIKGPPGTKVALRVRSPSTGRTRELEPRARPGPACRSCRAACDARAGARSPTCSCAGFSEGAHGELRARARAAVSQGRRGPRARPARQRRRAAQRGGADLERVRRAGRDRLDLRPNPAGARLPTPSAARSTRGRWWC